MCCVIDGVGAADDATLGNASKSLDRVGGAEAVVGAVAGAVFGMVGTVCTDKIGSNVMPALPLLLILWVT